MKNLANVVIVGRPNVGKSSLFNRLVGRRAAVVSDREGVTRDRHYEVVDWDTHTFNLVDTGGWLTDTEIDFMADHVREQIEFALKDANVILFVVDAHTGIQDLDRRFARILQKQSQAKVLLIMNKAEKQEHRDQFYEFLPLGFGDPICVSAQSGLEIGNMLSHIVDSFPPEEEFLGKEEEVYFAKMAILGRPNVGKSTLVNRLLGENRLVTSDKAGTTRDSIDCELEVDGKRVLLTDTAGLRKKAKVSDEVEYFSNMRSLESIRRADLCALMVDANLGVEKQDLRIIQQIISAGKGLFLILNKWDAIEKDGKSFDKLVKELRNDYQELAHIPIVTISALTGQRVHRFWDIVWKVRTNMWRILGRDKLVEVFAQAVENNPHPHRRGKPVLMTRACQVMLNPPVVAIECSQPPLVDENWKRYFLNRLHQEFELEGAVVKLNFNKDLRLRKDEELEEYAS